MSDNSTNSNGTTVDGKPYYKFYHYDPSFAAAILFTILFGLTSIWHLFLIYTHRTWYFIPMLIGGIFEIVGYAARAISNKEAPNLSLGPFVIQTLLILVAPALLAASIYMILGRIIISVDAESYSLIKKRWLTKVFVTSDVISFFVQLGGGGLMASSNASSAKLGSHIVLAGLIVQIIIFGFFVVVSLVFHRRLAAMPTHLSNNPALPWKKYLYLLYATSTFIMVRSIVRVAEFVEGFEGNIIMHEVYLYCFDGIPMLAVMIAYNIWYPSNFSKQARKAIALRDSVDSNVELSSYEPRK